MSWMLHALFAKRAFLVEDRMMEIEKIFIIGSFTILLATLLPTVAATFSHPRGDLGYQRQHITLRKET